MENGLERRSVEGEEVTGGVEKVTGGRGGHMSKVLHMRERRSH